MPTTKFFKSVYDDVMSEDPLRSKPSLTIGPLKWFIILTLSVLIWFGLVVLGLKLLKLALAWVG